MSKLILSIDGGGIRGAAVMRFLVNIEKDLRENYKRSLRDCVDFYSGTSTGSMIALALATTDIPVEDIYRLYSVETAQTIFTKNQGWFEIDGINAPKYMSDGKTNILKTALKNSVIGDVPKGKHVLVILYDFEKRLPIVIKSTDVAQHKLLSYEVADASSAAPTYFPTRELQLNPGEKTSLLIDGGVIANNPTMCALAEASRAWPKLPFNRFRVLSIGTGFRTRQIDGQDSKKWGALQWVTKGKILDLLADERIVAYQAMSLVTQGKYIRVNSELKVQPGLSEAPSDAMDDVSETNVQKLGQLGDFWYDKYGEAVVKLLLNRYKNASLDRINLDTGEPYQREELKTRHYSRLSQLTDHIKALFQGD